MISVYDKYATESGIVVDPDFSGFSLPKNLQNASSELSHGVGSE